MKALLGLLSIAALHAGESPMAFPTATWETSTPEAQGLDRGHLDQAMAQIQAICGADGNRQTVVIRNGYLLWQGDEAGKRHLVWSCTKSFMSTCLGLLWDDGICTPDTLASRYLPALAAEYPSVTLAHLASFTSGYAHAEGRPDVPARPLYPPGAAFDYSSQADLLAVLLTAAAGEPLHDLFMRRVGTPIGLDDGEFRWGVQALPGPIAINGGAGAAGSGVELTARAMARFGWLYCRRGSWNGRQLISARYIDAATAVRVPVGVPPYDGKAWYVDVPGRYGLNWWVNGVAANGKRLWPSVPASAFAAQGNKNNICIIVPEWNLVLVRLGEDKIIDVSLFDGPLRLLGEGLRPVDGPAAPQP
jgi:CubicO group peptidase (beta-lactamase class C family)